MDQPHWVSGLLIWIPCVPPIQGRRMLSRSIASQDPLVCGWRKGLELLLLSLNHEMPRVTLKVSLLVWYSTHWIVAMVNCIYIGLGPGLFFIYVYCTSFIIILLLLLNIIFVVYTFLPQFLRLIHGSDCWCMTPCINPSVCPCILSVHTLLEQMDVDWHRCDARENWSLDCV